MIHQFSTTRTTISLIVFVSCLWGITCLPSIYEMLPYLSYGSFILSAYCIHNWLKTLKSVELTSQSLKLNYILGEKEIPYKSIAVCCQETLSRRAQHNVRKARVKKNHNNSETLARLWIFWGNHKKLLFSHERNLPTAFYQALLEKVEGPFSVDKTGAKLKQGNRYFSRTVDFIQSPAPLILGLLLLSLSALNNFYFFWFIFLTLTLIIINQAISPLSIDVKEQSFTTNYPFHSTNKPISAYLSGGHLLINEALLIQQFSQNDPEYKVRDKPLGHYLIIFILTILLGHLIIFTILIGLLMLSALFSPPLPKHWTALSSSTNYEIKENLAQPQSKTWLSHLPKYKPNNDDYDTLNRFYKTLSLNAECHKMIEQNTKLLTQFYTYTGPSSSPDDTTDFEFSKLLFSLVLMDLSQHGTPEDYPSFCTKLAQALNYLKHYTQATNGYLFIHTQIIKIYKVVDQSRLSNSQKIETLTALLEFLHQINKPSLVASVNAPLQIAKDSFYKNENGASNHLFKHVFTLDQNEVLGKVATLEEQFSQPLTDETMRAFKLWQPRPKRTNHLIPNILECTVVDAIIYVEIQTFMANRVLRSSTVESLKTIIALEHFYADHQYYPDALNALIPNYLEKLPTDIFSGDESPLGYQKLADGSYQLNDQKARVEGLFKAKAIDFSNPLVPLLQK